ncbi:MAG: GNAT family N-acetyltransferase [Xanthomonadales bacterium]|nr:GNAT family N-acetyltransferase [Xanthomonadales bacterium]
MALTSTAPITGSFPRPRPTSVSSSPLVLEPLAADDESLFVMLYSDPATMHFIGLPLAKRRARANFHHALRQWRESQAGFLYWRIREPGKPRPIGLIALVFDTSGPRRCAEIGVMLRPEARRRKLSKIAMWMLARQAFDHGLADELRARHAPSHVAVRRLLEGLGYRREAVADGSSEFVHWLLRREDMGDSWNG